MSNYAQGFQSWMAIAAEKTWGTISASPTWEYGAIQKNGIKPWKAPVAYTDITAGRYLKRHLRGPLRVSGPVSYSADPDGMLGRMLYMLFGSCTGAAKIHTFIPQAIASMPAGITARWAHDDVAIATDVWQATGGVVSKLSFSAKDAKSLLECSADMHFKDAASSGTALSPTYPAADPFPTWGATITVDTVACPLHSFDLTIENGTNADRTDLAAASGLIIRPLPGMFKASGSFGAYFTDLTLVNKILNGTSAALDVTFTQGTNSLEFQIPLIYYTGDMPTTDGTKEILLKANFEAYKTTGELVTAILTNNQTGVYADAGS